MCVVGSITGDKLNKAECDDETADEADKIPDDDGVGECAKLLKTTTAEV